MHSKHIYGRHMMQVDERDNSGVLFVDTGKPTLLTLIVTVSRPHHRIFKRI